MPGNSKTRSTQAADRFYLAWLAAVYVLLLPLPTLAQDLGFVCENNGLTRSVKVVSEPGFACRVKYSKSSATSYPWNARADADYCAPRHFPWWKS